MFVVATLFTFAPATTTVRADEHGEATVTATGWVIKYIDDDEGIFTDGVTQIVIETEGDGSIKQLAMNQPYSITGKVVSKYPEAGQYLVQVEFTFAASEAVNCTGKATMALPRHTA